MTTADLVPKSARGAPAAPAHGQGAAAARNGVTQDTAGIALVTVTLLAIIMPFGFFLGSLYLTPSRLLFLFTVPYLGLRLVLGHYGPRLPTDYFVLGYAVWMMLALAINHQAQAVTLSVSNALVMLGGYLTGRVGIRSLGQMQRFVRLYGWIVVLMLPIALVDSLTGRVIVGDILGSISPGWLRPVVDINYPPRLGLERAQVFFVHPIHLGLFAAFPVALYYVGLRSLHSAFHRTMMTGLILCTCFLSLSSGPLVAGAFPLLLIGYMLVTEQLENQWKLLLWSGAAVYAVLEVLSDRSAIFALASRLAFSAHNAYFRRELFDVGIDQIGRTPIFGIGFHRPPSMPSWMPNSFDNYWVLVAVSNGLPAFAFVVLAFLYPMIRAGRGQLRKGSPLYDMRVGWTFAIIGLALGLATVSVWNQLFSTVFLILGAGQFLLIAKEPDSTAPLASEPGQKAQNARGPRYSRYDGVPLRREPAQAQYARTNLSRGHARSEPQASPPRPGGKRPRKE